jgi:radical SAM protein with 4Fe4S-binding SPASM domain
MIIRRHGPGYNFYGNTETGLTMRWGGSPQVNPVYAPWPELADISISNHCTKECGFCYRDSGRNYSFMSVEQYEYVLSALRSERWESVFQVALGGGEPLEHPDFREIIRKTNEKGIVVNFTTNGIYLDAETVDFLKGRIGALAISADGLRKLDGGKIKLLAEAGIKTNIHFILDNRSIHEAVEILKGKHNGLLKHINGVVFLTYKPVGRAAPDRCLNADPHLAEFTALIDKNRCVSRIGFDACFVPVLMKHTDINVDYVDSCECGFFSVYIDEKLNVKPCSFANNDRFSYNLKEYAMELIWKEKFEEYRQEVTRRKCSNECKNRDHCRGKCFYYEVLSLC